MEQIIHSYADYDLWANTRIVERLQREADAVLDRHVKSSFPSLRLSILHIRDAGHAWYQRIFGQPMDLDESIGSLLKLSSAMADRVHAANDALLSGNVTYTTSKGLKYTQPRWQLLMHCFNHSSYHRGQVITIMRQLDLGEVPNTDMVAYQRLRMAAS
jgi:uncharacterized damage-inducible protein DinB